MAETKGGSLTCQDASAFLKRLGFETKNLQDHIAHLLVGIFAFWGWKNRV